MNFLKDLQKMINGNRIIFLVGILVIGLLIGQYSMGRGMVTDGMSANQPGLVSQHANKPVHDMSGSESAVQAANPLGENSDFASATGMGTTSNGLPPSCTKEPIQDPASLLPSDENSEWARLNPSGQGNLNSVNLLKSGHHIGIDTIGQSLRNANLQLRSEPANPQVNIGPWQNTTIEPDLMRTPLEIGQGPQ